MTYNLETGEENIVEVPSYVYSVDWSIDGTLFAIGAGEAYILDAHNGELLYTLTDLGGWVKSVSWSPDGSKLAAGDSNSNIWIWEIATQVQP